MITQGPITIYNKRLGADRRDLYYPTAISAASYAEKKGSSHSGGATTESLSYRIRIPLSARTTQGRKFIPEAKYKGLSEAETRQYWTIAKLDLVTRGSPLTAGPADEKTIKEAAARAGLDVIVVEEYADNTGRGSPAVQHWRIGGR